MTPPDQLELATFAALEGQEFRIQGSEIVLTLAAVRKTGEPYPGFTRVPFALNFVGAPGLRIEQGTQVFENITLGVLPIFITQNSLAGTGSEFEAVFS